jgi:hypothetical protein
MSLKKSMRIISLLICISTTTGVKSERPLLWISLMSTGYVATTIAGGLLGYFFPSPALEQNGNNNSWVVGAIATGGAYMCLFSAAAVAKSCYDGVCCNDEN